MTIYAILKKTGPSYAKHDAEPVTFFKNKRKAKKKNEIYGDTKVRKLTQKEILRLLKRLSPHHHQKKLGKRKNTLKWEK